MRIASRRAQLIATPITATCSPRLAGYQSLGFRRNFADEKKGGAPENAHESAAKEQISDASTDQASKAASSSSAVASEASSSPSSTPKSSSSSSLSPNEDWEENPNFNIEKFSELPHSNFGVNQHMIINDEFKEALRQVLWQFRAPIRYAFAYGSGVFPQSKSEGRVPTEAEIKAIHPKAPLSVQRAQDGTPKMIDFIFGVTFTQHWHSLNLNQHRDHYSALGSLGSGAVSFVQDRWGAGMYFNTYVVVNGILIKYGVVNLDTLCRDLSEWDTLYLAGRLHKPVKILRDDARVRLANQMNLLSALRTALLMLPPNFTEQELYSTIAGISYLGDPRMAFPTENPRKVSNIVTNNMSNFRRLYAPLIETLPNVEFDDPNTRTHDWLTNPEVNFNLRQDMDPVKRGNMVRRLPKAFRSRLYFKYQSKFGIPQLEFNKMMDESKNEDSTSFKRQQGGGFERRIAQDEPEQLRTYVRQVIKQTINWPSTTQSLKGLLTAGFRRTFRYLGEKLDKYREGKKPKEEPKKPVSAPKGDNVEAEDKSPSADDKKGSN